MSRLNPDCWLWSPRPPLGLLPQSPGSLASVPLSHREEEEEEEEEEEHPSDRSYTTGIPSSSGLAGQGPGAPSSQQPAAVIDADGEDASRFTGAGCWEGPRMETRGCVCVYGQREPEGLGPCWPGSPYIYYGVRRRLLVGVEVVEEVAVEDTLEVITEDMYMDDLLQDVQMFPT